MTGATSTLETAGVEIPEIVKSVTSKDTAYSGYLGQVDKWKQANELAGSMGMPATPEPVMDVAAETGKKFAEMRSQVGLEVENIRSGNLKDVEAMKAKFEKQILAINDGKDPEEKVVKMGALLDKSDRIIREISLTVSASALEKCPDAIHIATQFQHGAITSFVNADYRWVADNAIAIEKLAPKLEPLASDRRDNLVEVEGEVTGVRLFEGVRNALQNGAIAKEQIIPLLETRGIPIEDLSFTTAMSELKIDRLDGQNLPRILARVARKMEPGDGQNKLLGLTLGYNSRMIDSRPPYERDESGYLKATEASFNVVTELLGDKVSWAEFLHQGKTEGVNLPPFITEKIHKMGTDRNRNLITRDIGSAVDRQHRQMLDSRKSSQ